MSLTTSFVWVHSTISQWSKIVQKLLFNDLQNELFRSWRTKLFCKKAIKLDVAQEKEGQGASPKAYLPYYHA